MTKFAIFTHTQHIQKNNELYAYAPYVKEMNIWGKYVDEIVVVAPLSKNKEITPIHLAYQHENIRLVTIPSFDLKSFKGILKTLFVIPVILYKILKIMRYANHLHLRCPGNIGLLACIVQTLFPKKNKTVKYAGNWDPKSVQPLSYRLQKRIVSNTFLSKNIKVLVYGEWKKQTKNIIPFFTATYSSKEVIPVKIRDFQESIKFVFVGSLSEGKRPLLVVKIIEELLITYPKIKLDIFGDGILMNELKEYIENKTLKSSVVLHGNVSALKIKKELSKANFLMLPSKSEGWPKVVAEAMFWGTLPIATPISCIPYMLSEGERGILIQPEVVNATNQIKSYINSFEKYKIASEKAVNWSQSFTTDRFENEIVKILE